MSLRIALWCLMIVAQVAYAQTPDPWLQGFDVASPVDLAKIPLSAELANRAGLFFRDQVLEREWNEQLSKLTTDLDELLVSDYGGYLAEVVIFVDDLGNVRIPGGNMVVPIGPGTEPVDALAKYQDTGSYRHQAPPPPFRERSYYMWFTKQDRKLVALTMPQEATAVFRARAREVLRSRRLQTAVPRMSLQRNLTRAKFWLQVEKDYLAEVEDARIRGRIASLTGEMRSLEDKADAAYAEYQEMRLRMIEASQHLAFLQRLESVASIISDGIRTGELLTRANTTPATTSAGNPYPIAEEIQVTKTTIDRTTGEVRKMAATYRRYDTQVQQRENEVRRLYNQGGVEVPPRH